MEILSPVHFIMIAANINNGKEFTSNDSEMTTGLKIIIGASRPYFLVSNKFEVLHQIQTDNMLVSCVYTLL